MTPVIPSSTSNIFTIPGCSFDARKVNTLIKSSNLTKVNKRTLYSQQFHLNLSKSLRLFPHYGSNRRPRFGKVSATGVDVAVEQVDQSESTVSDQDSGQSSEPPLLIEKSNDEESSNKSKQRSRPVRKSEMPPVKDEELVPGATFTGKVRSIQPFGAFIDFGAFTDGLVHVSRLSDSYVKDVASVVSVGQEVKVKLVEANTETGRISLTMRENEPSGGEKSRSLKRNGKKSNEGRKATKFVKGQDLDGTVKNLTRSGAFINLPEGEEGFLPASEEADEGFGNIMGGSSLEIGQEVKVRVLRIARGQLTLTMKKEEDVKALDSKLQGKVFTATNPFLVAFRKNKDIAEFLDEREKVEELTSIDVDQESQETVEVTESLSVVEDEEVKIEKESISSEGQIQTSDEKTEIASLTPDEDEKVKPVVDEKVKPVEKIEDEEVKIEKEGISSEAQIQTSDEKTEIASLTPDEDEKVKPVVDEKVKPVEKIEVSSPPIVQDETSEPAVVEISSIASLNEESDAPVIEEKIEETQTSEIIDNKIEETTPKVEVVAEVPSVTPPLEDENVEQNGSIIDSNAPSETTDNKIEETTPKVEVDADVPSATPPLEDENVEQNGSIIDSNAPSETTATISPALVKKLREETGAGMMDCKKALLETNGEIVKAQEYLRKKGLASADKKAHRATAEGRIGSYVHDSRIGVLIEVNCETDFVSRGEIFKELVNDLAMQVAACPQVQFLQTEDVPKEIVEKEKSIEMQKEDLLSKPEQIRSKIVEGRIKKRVEELALLEQAYIKDDKMVVKDFVKSTISTVGENIKVKRFVRFNLGEGLEKKSQDFAAEVAAQTSAKPVSAPAKEQQPAPTEAVEISDKAPKVAISAALVKQLREETGAGMMDCKKALSETGGDLEKSQEYLRKKGLLTADKKSTRLAAEGRIGSYIHDSRIGVLIEVNCETDFVGRSEKFKNLVEDLAMQVVACPKVEYVSIEDIPESIVDKEKQIEMQREDILAKPENIRGKIVQGRVSKRLGELALLEQAYLKDDTILVKDLVKQSVAAIGENIKVRRFVRFTLGESTESKSESTESKSEEAES